MKKPKPKRKLTMMVIHGDRRIDQMMHRADLFEGWKTFARLECYTVTLKPGCTIKRAVTDTRKVLEAAGQHVAFILTDHQQHNYYDGYTTAISDGMKWHSLDQKFLKLFKKKKP